MRLTDAAGRHHSSAAAGASGMSAAEPKHEYTGKLHKGEAPGMVHGWLIDVLGTRIAFTGARDPRGASWVARAGKCNTGAKYIDQPPMHHAGRLTLVQLAGVFMLGLSRAHATGSRRSARMMPSRCVSETHCRNSPGVSASG